MLRLARRAKGFLPAVVVVGGLALVFTAVVLMFGQPQHLKSQPTPSAVSAAPFSQLENLHALCVKDMIASTCKVMGTATSTDLLRPAKPGEQVFIAGVGAIAAADYQQMYEAGDAMCSVVRTACSDDWQSSRCQTARKLLGG